MMKEAKQMLVHLIKRRVKEPPSHLQIERLAIPRSLLDCAILSTYFPLNRNQCGRWPLTLLLVLKVDSISYKQTPSPHVFV
jgi:hypothetical protein